MVGTAGLPHVIVRFFTVKKVSDARKSAGIALLLIAILYTTAPAVAAFARTNLLETISTNSYDEIWITIRNVSFLLSVVTFVIASIYIKKTGGGDHFGGGDHLSGDE